MKKEGDQLLHIKTDSFWEEPMKSKHYNHYEATPYLILDTLFNEYPLDKTDEFVDFGCGKGRVLFYVHDRFKNRVTGIEMNEQLYYKAKKNELNYSLIKRDKGRQIHFECCKAEEYEVKNSENKFYFFNPFSTQIFMKVVNNILKSIEQYNRPVDLILYYPIAEYIDFLDKKTPFEFKQEIQIPGHYRVDHDERFLIYNFGRVDSDA